MQSKSDSDYIPNLSTLAAQHVRPRDRGRLPDGRRASRPGRQAVPVARSSRSSTSTHGRRRSAARTSRASLFHEEESGYVAGYLAGLMQKVGGSRNNGKNVMSTVGGSRSRRSTTTSRASRRAPRRPIRASRRLNGYSNSFTDRPSASRSPQTQLAQGSDVVFAVAGGAASARSTPPKREGRLGRRRRRRPERTSAPHMLASAVKQVDFAVFPTIAQAQAGHVQGRHRRPSSASRTSPPASSGSREAVPAAGQDQGQRRSSRRSRPARSRSRTRSSSKETWPTRSRSWRCRGARAPTWRSSSAASPSASGALVANDAHRPRPAARRDPRAARRERRRQVHADELALRPATRRTRARSCVGGAAGAHALLGRRDPPRDRHGAPALHADPGDDGRREHRARRRAAARCRCSTSARGRASASATSRSATASWSTRDARVEDISVGTQQRVEILKALYRDAKVLILDEPTAVLTPQEIDDLLRRPARAARSAARRSSSSRTSSTRSCRSPTASACCAAARRSPRSPRPAPTERSLAELMVGRPVLSEVERGAGASGRGGALDRRPPRARRSRDRDRARALARGARAARSSASPASTATARPSSPRRSPACATSLGHDPPRRRDVTDASPRAARRGGHRPHPAGSPAPRPRARLQPGREQALHDYERPPISRLGWLNPQRHDRAGHRRLIERFDVRGGSPRRPARALSGGNQQKLVLAREIDLRPAAAARRAADARARRRRHRVRAPPADRAARRGRGRAADLVRAGRDLRLSDRILVMYEGSVTLETRPDQTNETELGLAMTGGNVRATRRRRREGAPARSAVPARHGPDRVRDRRARRDPRRLEPVHGVQAARGRSGPRLAVPVPPRASGARRPGGLRDQPDPHARPTRRRSCWRASPSASRSAAASSTSADRASTGSAPIWPSRSALYVTDHWHGHGREAVFLATSARP